MARNFFFMVKFPEFLGSPTYVVAASRWKGICGTVLQATVKQWGDLNIVCTMHSL